LRRAGFLHLVAIVLLAGGGGCAAIAWARPDPADVMLRTAAGLLAGAAVAGLGAVASLRGEARRIAAAMRAAVEQGPAGARAVDAGATAFGHVVAAANEVLDAARAAEAAAAVRVRSLEIELKVATAERQHAEAIIRSISDGVLVTSPFDEVVLANDAAAKTFGFALDADGEAAGEGGTRRCPVEQLLSDRTMVDLIREMRQSGTRHGRRVVEHQVRTAAGGDRTYKVTMSCVADAAGDPAGVVAVLHDMTREKEVAELKNDFVSNVSHELRTPLASIRAYVEMLIDGEATDDRTRTEFYDVIQYEANRLGRLIDNILNISRIESGLVKVNKQAQSLSVVVKEALEVISPQAKAKQIRLVERLAPVLYQTSVDHDMLYQAVLNLMSNAVKYTPEGGQVTVETVVDEARRTIATRITDTGVGIPPKDLPFVFDKFYRAEANNRMAKGTGLGLSLVKHIVEAVHQGRIVVESTVGKGSTFGFELDLVE
jgi:two-component system phosphate regulon sensor histidine kinase PhoR